MSKIAKTCIALAFVLAVVSFIASVKVADLVENKAERIRALEESLQQTQEKLRETERTRDKLEAQLAAEKEKTADLRRRLKSANERVAGLRKELGERKEKIGILTAAVKKTEQRIDVLERGMAACKGKLHEAQRELVALRKITSEVGLRGTEGAPEIISGEIVSIHESGLLNLKLTGAFLNCIGNEIFIHREEEVVAIARFQNIYNTVMVVKVKDKEGLGSLKPGDDIAIDAEEGRCELPYIEGKILSAPVGFLTISVKNLPPIKPNLIFSVSRGGKVVGKIDVEGIDYMMVVAEVTGDADLKNIKMYDVVKASK